jgi:hypothetical protein
MREVDSTSDLGALVDAAQHSDGPSAEDRERVRKQLFARIASGAAAGAVIATTSATATATTVATTTSLSAVFAKALGAIVLVSAVSATGVYAARQRSASPRATTTIPTQPARATQREEPQAHTQSSRLLIHSAPARASVAVAAPVTAPELARVEPARARTAVTPAATRPTQARATQEPATTAIEPSITPAPTANTLGDELALITAARAALAGGRAADALASLDRYGQRFSRGMLRPESLAARVDALCALGERERARAVAAAFVAEFPSSALAARVRNACP